MALSEAPFFTQPISDIEVVHFERVSLAIKNFDFVIVCKDYTTFKRISSVPMESLDTIKDWLDTNDIIFTEGPISLNWQALLTQIKSDFASFIDQGGWQFLNINGGESESESVNSDSNFNSDDERQEAGGSGDSEDDYSGGSDSEADSGAESSDVRSDNSEDTEGMDWDEMERQTIQKEKAT